jgi:hypothetical protein
MQHMTSDLKINQLERDVMLFEPDKTPKENKSGEYNSLPGHITANKCNVFIRQCGKMSHIDYTRQISFVLSGT